MLAFTQYEFGFVCYNAVLIHEPELIPALPWDTEGYALHGAGTAMASLFLSYASGDSSFALRLAHSLRALGHAVWVDRWEIAAGDSLVGQIEQGLSDCEYLIVVLSRHTMQSVWVRREVHTKLYEEITNQQTRVLPIVVEECAIPLLLRPKRLTDFRSGYEIGLVQLALTLHALEGQRVRSETVPPLLPSSLYSTGGYNDVMLHQVAKLSELNVEIGIPYLGKVSGVWKPEKEEERASWELYIELVTRTSVAGLPDNAGLLRESLTSLYDIFTTTREILRKYGPAVARPARDSDLSFGLLAIHLLNYVLRPVLTTWHPLLLDYEHSREAGVSVLAHEQQWDRAAELRHTLDATRAVLSEYTKVLAQVAGIPQIV